MNISYTSYSLPFKWWDVTNIAHNRIFARCVIEFDKRNHQQFILNSNPDPITANHLDNHRTKVVPSWLTGKILGESDVLIVFCGPFLPIPDKNNMTYRTLDLIRRFEGRVVYVTCDYLLQLDLRTSRYGKLTKDWPEDALLRNKDYRYVIHGGFDHHFRTEVQRNRILSFIPRENFIEVPLNKSGIRPINPYLTPASKPEIDLLYCGSFRTDRVETFKKYFCSPEAAKWTISTTQEKKFANLPGMKASIRGPYTGMIWKYINKSLVQIIFSDDTDTKCPTTPLPTRYWEALSAGSVVIFDESCQVWFEYNGEHLPRNPIMVTGPEGLSEVIKHLRKYSGVRHNRLADQEAIVENFNPYVEWRMGDWIA